MRALRATRVVAAGIAVRARRSRGRRAVDATRVHVLVLAARVAVPSGGERRREHLDREGEEHREYGARS